jgi:hypothetical protein
MSKNTSRTSLQELIANETPGGRGLLAYELAKKTNRVHGPLDGNCEMCGQAAESFLLADWLHWHCLPCAMKAA